MTTLRKVVKMTCEYGLIVVYYDNGDVIASGNYGKNWTSSN